MKIFWEKRVIKGKEDTTYPLYVWIPLGGGRWFVYESHIDGVKWFITNEDELKQHYKIFEKLPHGGFRYGVDEEFYHQIEPADIDRFTNALWVNLIKAMAEALVE